MGNIINLRRARKNLARKAREQAATQKKIQYGTSKKMRNQSKSLNEQFDKNLDNHKLPTQDGKPDKPRT